MKRLLLILAVVGLYVLHQDVWFFKRAEPLLFGFVPVGLWYHAVFTLAVVGLMWLLVAWAWPGHLEREAESKPSPGPQHKGDAR